MHHFCVCTLCVSVCVWLRHATTCHWLAGGTSTCLQNKSLTISYSAVCSDCVHVCENTRQTQTSRVRSERLVSWHCWEFTLWHLTQNHNIWLTWEKNNNKVCCFTSFLSCDVTSPLAAMLEVFICLLWLWTDHFSTHPLNWFGVLSNFPARSVALSPSTFYSEYVNL